MGLKYYGQRTKKSRKNTWNSNIITFLFLLEKKRNESRMGKTNNVINIHRNCSINLQLSKYCEMVKFLAHAFYTSSAVRVKCSTLYVVRVTVILFKLLISAPN